MFLCHIFCFPGIGNEFSDFDLVYVLKNRTLAVHWDLDVLSPTDFRCIYPAEPYTDVTAFPAAVGRMKLNSIGRLLNDVAVLADIVGLSITEHLPWDAFNMRKMLSDISIFKGQ